MREIVTFDSRKLEDLGALISNLDAGDLIRCYYSGPPINNGMLEHPMPPYIGNCFSSPCAGSRIIVSGNNLSTGSLQKTDILGEITGHFYLGNPYRSPVGVFSGFTIGETRAFIDQNDKREYRTDRAMWLMLATGYCETRERDQNPYNMNRDVPSLFIDVDCLGAFERLTAGTISPMDNESLNIIIDMMKCKEMKSFSSRFSKEEICLLESIGDYESNHARKQAASKVRFTPIDRLCS